MAKTPSFTQKGIITAQTELLRGIVTAMRSPATDQSLRNMVRTTIHRLDAAGDPVAKSGAEFLRFIFTGEDLFKNQPPL